MKKRLLAILNIRTGEEHTVFLMLAQYFFMGAAMLFVQSASLALFFTAWDASAMPYIYIGIALIVSSVTAIFLKISERTSLARFLILSVLFVLLGSIALRAGLAISTSKWLIFVLPIWSQTLVNITVTAFWTLAGNIFDVRQGKRIFGLMNAGSWLAYVVMGPFTTPLVEQIGTENLYLVIAACLLIAFFLQQAVIRTNPGTQAAPEYTTDQAHQASIPQLFRIRYIALIFALITIWRVSYFVLDNVFYDQAALQYPSANEMAGFIGGFFGLVGLLGFLTDMFLTGRIISRFGLRAGLLATPTLTILFMAALAVTGTLNPQTTSILFWLAVAGKFTNEGMGFSLDQTAQNLLYQPIHDQIRARAQTVTEGIIQPLAIGLAGGLLLLFNTTLKFNAIQLTYIYLFTAAIWVIICLTLIRAYPAALTQALHKRRFGEQGILLTDAGSIQIVRNALKSQHPSEVIYALDLLEKGESDTLSVDLAAAIRSPMPEVRKDATQRAERLNFSILMPVILSQLKVETVDDVKEAAACATIVLGADSNTAIHLLKQKDQALQRGALVGSLRLYKPDATSQAFSQLEELASSEDIELRVTAAKIIAESANPALYLVLLPLLKAEEISVKKSALHAAKNINHPAIYPSVITALGSSQTRSLAFNALTSGKNEALPAIIHALKDEGLHRRIHLRLIRACSQIKSEAAIHVLEGLICHLNINIRSKALMALHDCEYKPEGKSISMVSEQVSAELRRAAWLLGTIRDLGQSEKTNVVQRAASLDLDESIQRLFELFGFLYDRHAIQRAKDTIQRRDLKRKGYAIEVLDTTLGKAHKKAFIPLLEDLPVNEKLEKMGSEFNPYSLKPAARVVDILGSPFAMENPWLLATAMEAAKGLGIPLGTETLNGVTASNESLLVQMIKHEGKENKMLNIVERVIILKSLSMFEHTPDEALAELAGLLQELIVQAGDVVIREGESGDSLYIVVDGKVEVVDDNRVLNQLGARAVFGELSMLDSSPRTATIRALEETSLLRLDQTSFYEIMSDYVEVAMGTIQLLTRNLRARTGDVMELSRMLGQ
ncbi:MAG: cyclic nucleotide-binding domain-containing protein [Anaerolineales bacterium]|nr:cyclic nucleotide-binding domain-containing protein [Anaerolineales bacterium]MCB9145573.1 cyclic nucleotide-binding domain-containing protein [Anaerolineales bacterium]